MKILSLDQSTVNSGYAVYNDNRILRWGLIDEHKTRVASVRFEHMCMRIHAMIMKTKPDVVVFEDVSYHNSVSTAIKLANLQGAIMQDCYELQIPYVIYAPQHWRKVDGLSEGKAKRDELKQRSINFVKDNFGIKVNDDCAEAICIGVAYLKNNDIIKDFTDIKCANNR